MINHSYLKYTIRSNIKFLILFTVVLCVFLTVMIQVFTPETVEQIHTVTQGTIVSNILNGNGTLIGFMANSFYSIMAILFPMIYSIVVGNRLIAEKVEKGSMAGFLATPMTRLQLVCSSALYFIMSLVLMWGIVSIVGIGLAEQFQPDNLDVSLFLKMNLGVLLYHFLISSICFCSSCMFDSSKNSLIFGAGIPIYCFVISLFMKLSGELDFLKYVTLDTLFDKQAILEGTGYVEKFYIMAFLGICCYGMGITQFVKRDLPL